MQIELSGDGFALTLPSGRKLSIPNTEFASGFIYRILWDAAHGGERKGYIGSYPTQALVDGWTSRAKQDAWLAQNAEDRLAATLEGLGLTDLNFDL